MEDSDTLAIAGRNENWTAALVDWVPDPQWESISDHMVAFLDLKMNVDSAFGEKDGIVGVPCITCVYEGGAKTGGFLHVESYFRAPDHSETLVLNI